MARALALLSASIAAGTKDVQAAIDFAQQAVDLVTSADEIPATEIAKAFGELAIAQWLAKDLRSAFGSWDRAGELLLSSRDDTDRWKGLFVVFGHLSGYLSSIAYFGQPPSETQTGEQYAAPYR